MSLVIEISNLFGIVFVVVGALAFAGVLHLLYMAFTRRMK